MEWEGRLSLASYSDDPMEISSHHDRPTSSSRQDQSTPPWAPSSLMHQVRRRLWRTHQLYQLICLGQRFRNVSMATWQRRADTKTTPAAADPGDSTRSPAAVSLQTTSDTLAVNEYKRSTYSTDHGNHRYERAAVNRTLFKLDQRLDSNRLTMRERQHRLHHLG